MIIAATTYSLSHTETRMAATRRGARIASMVNVGEETFARAMNVDYVELARAGRRIADALTAASHCRVTTAAGTDVVLELQGRTAISDDGDLTQPGAFGNLPAGEGYIAPIEVAGEGTIVFDGALADHGLLRKPLTVTLEEGRAIDAEGDRANWLLETLDAGGPTGRQIAELGPTSRRTSCTGCPATSTSSTVSRRSPTSAMSLPHSLPWAGYCTSPA